MLRKLMIAYFIVEVWTYVLLTIFLIIHYDFNYFAAFMPYLLIPKTIIKLFLLKYLRSVNK